MNAEVPSVQKPVIWLKTVQILFAVASLGAGYLVMASLSKERLAGCGAGSGCEFVLQSRWAYWMDIPVSLPALIVYLTLLITVVILPKVSSLDHHRGSWMILICFSVLIGGSALWFIGLQAFVLMAFCKFCLLIHSCGILAAVLCLLKIPRCDDPRISLWSSGATMPGLPMKGILQLVGIGFLGIAVLIGGQLAFPTRLNLVKESESRSQSEPIPDGVLKQTTKNKRALSPSCRLISPRLLSLFQDKVLLRLDELPLIGKPDAPHVIVALTDYACPHCRLLHQVLVQTQRRHSTNLAIILLPMPASTNCNPYVPAGLPSNSNSCEYAKLSLAVWRSQPALYRSYEEWMYSTFKAKTAVEAQNYAANLVGAEKLAEGLTNAWIEQQIRTNCYLHHLTTQATGKPTLPQIIMGDAVSIGSVDSVHYLLALIEKYLGLKMPSL